VVPVADSEKQASDSLDPFGLEESSDSNKMAAEVTENQTLESQFDDLMGGFGDAQNGVSNGEVIITETTESMREESSSQGDREGSPALSDAGREFERAASQTSSQDGTRFEDTIADFQPPKRYVKEEKPAPASSHAAASTFIMGGAGDNMCKICQKRVYEMEKIIADNKIYHKTCFKCNHCNRVLSLGNFAGID